MATTRKSLALRTGAVEPLRPSQLGYVDFSGEVTGFLSTTRTALSSLTTLGFAVKVKLDALGAAQNLAGWDSNNAGLAVNVTTNTLKIYATSIVPSIIGNANSTAAIPAVAATQPTWLRGKLTIATAMCEYWYSTDETDDFDQVKNWVVIGIPTTGTNAGATPALSGSTPVVVGNVSETTLAAMTGNVYAFAEIINGVKRSWFSHVDIPDSSTRTFTSSGGGQVWTLSAAVPQAAFHHTTIYSGAIRADFAWDDESLGLAPDTLLGITDLGYRAIRVSYQPALIPDHPTLGAYQEAMIVRSSAGFPATNLDGAMLMRNLNNDPSLNQGWASVVDSDLAPQRWYYYSVFARYDTTSGWFKVAEEAWLNPGMFGYSERMWDAWPEYYRRIDGGYGYPGILKRFTGMLAYEMDLHRTWAATVGDVWDYDKLSAKMLPEAATALGLVQNIANGDRRLRTVVGNLMALRKTKGTRDSVEGYIAALTGYPTRIYEGLNLLHRTQHTEWPYSFTAQDGSASPQTDNHPGWTTIVGISSPGTSQGQLSRQTAAGGEGSGISMPDGSFYLRSTNTTGGALALTFQYGHFNYLPSATVPVIAGNSYAFSAAFKASVASTVLNLTVTWVNEVGTSFGTTTNNTLITAGTGWARAKSTTTLTAPAGSKYAVIRVFSNATLAASAHINMFKPLFADLGWRPEGIPTLKTPAPLSSVDAGDVGTYLHRDYYEAPREVKINIYPNRANLALNSDFTLNNLPAGAWSIFDAPTYAQLPVAYTDYADITDAAPDWEVDYADMVSGLYPLTGGSPPTIVYDTGGGRIHVDRTTTPYAYSIQHTYFDATELGGMSAAVGAYSTVAGVKMTMMFEWYTTNPITRINDAFGSPVRAVSPEYSLTTVETRYELVNAQPPATAVYGRLVIAFSHTAAHDTSLSWALIEDAPFPGPYFNGDFNDGDDGDFFYAKGKGFSGAAHLSPSVYYQSYNRFNGTGSDGLTTLCSNMLMPFRRNFKIVTGSSYPTLALYNSPT